VSYSLEKSEKAFKKRNSLKYLGKEEWGFARMRKRQGRDEVGAQTVIHTKNSAVMWEEMCGREWWPGGLW
jgi:hypothetical protein